MENVHDSTLGYMEQRAIKPIQNISYDLKKHMQVGWKWFSWAQSAIYTFIKNVFAWIQEGKALENKTQILSWFKLQLCITSVFENLRHDFGLRNSQEALQCV